MTEKKTKNIIGKWIALVLVFVLLFVPMLAGCDLVTRNEGKYLSQPVAKWKEITVDKENLIRT